MQSNLTIDFLPQNGNPGFTVSNLTSYSVHQDFFIPADEFEFTVEDDRAAQLQKIIYQGQTVEISINNKVIMRGYVEEIEFDFDRVGRGRSILVRGRDYLGVLADAHIFPNLNTGTATTFQFPQSTDLVTAMNTIIFNSQPDETTIAAVDFPNLEDYKDTIGQGFGAGVTRRKLLVKNLKRPTASILCPEKGETYLGYIRRLIKRTGLNMKMSYYNGVQAVRFTCPIYNFKEVKDNILGTYQFGHTNKNQSNLNSSSFTPVLNGKLVLSVKDMPSVIIVESYVGGPSFNKDLFKVVLVNDIIGYKPFNQQQQSALESIGYTTTNLRLSEQPYIPNVQEAINQLTNGQIVSTTSTSGTGYMVLPKNLALSQYLQNLPIASYSQFNRPEYICDVDSHTKDEAIVFAYKKMADYQNKYFNLEYTVVDHVDDDDELYTFDRMAFIDDEVYGFNGIFYLHSVNYTKSRHGGAITKLGFHIPWIQSFGAGVE